PSPPGPHRTDHGGSEHGGGLPVGRVPHAALASPLLRVIAAGALAPPLRALDPDEPGPPVGPGGPVVVHLVEPVGHPEVRRDPHRRAVAAAETTAAWCRVARTRECLTFDHGKDGRWVAPRISAGRTRKEPADGCPVSPPPLRSFHRDALREVARLVH